MLPNYNSVYPSLQLTAEYNLFGNYKWSNYEYSYDTPTLQTISLHHRRRVNDAMILEDGELA